MGCSALRCRVRLLIGISLCPCAVLGQEALCTGRLGPGAGRRRVQAGPLDTAETRPAPCTGPAARRQRRWRRPRRRARTAAGAQTRGARRSRPGAARRAGAAAARAPRCAAARSRLARPGRPRRCRAGRSARAAPRRPAPPAPTGSRRPLRSHLQLLTTTHAVQRHYNAVPALF